MPLVGIIGNFCCDVLLTPVGIFQYTGFGSQEKEMFLQGSVCQDSFLTIKNPNVVLTLWFTALLKSLPHGIWAELPTNLQRWARATFFWVPNRNSATRRKHFRNHNSATFKEMLLRNRNSAIPQSQFFWSPQVQVRNLRTSLPQFSAHFWPWNPVDSWKNNQR